MLNYVILIGKVFIKKCKSKIEHISFFGFLHFLKQRLQIEENIYKNINKKEFFMKHYGNLLEEL